MLKDMWCMYSINHPPGPTRAGSKPEQNTIAKVNSWPWYSSPAWTGHVAQPQLPTCNPKEATFPCSWRNRGGRRGCWSQPLTRTEDRYATAYSSKSVLSSHKTSQVKTFWTVQEQLDLLVLSNSKNINMSTIMLISFGMKYDKIICFIQCWFCPLSSQFLLSCNIQKVIQIAEHTKAESHYCLRFRKWLKLHEISGFSLVKRVVKFNITKGGGDSNCKYWWLYSFLLSIAAERPPFINRCLNLFDQELCMKLLASPYKLF
jgi:hypothetical protein